MITTIMALFENVPLSIARKRLIDSVVSEYTLVLDYNTIIPEDFIKKAMKMLKDNKRLACVAIPHTRSLHPVFGCSIWKTFILKSLYNWKGTEGSCECCHMFKKVRESGYKVGTILGMVARHRG